MKRLGWTSWALVLTGLLGLAALSIFLGKGNDAARPSASSYEPSGLRAFADLVRTQGYKVRVDTSLKPTLKPGDVAVLAYVEVEQGEEVDERIAFDAYILSQVANGVNALSFQVPRQFRSASLTAQSSENVVDRFDKRAQLKLSSLDGNEVTLAGPRFSPYSFSANVSAMTVNKGQGTYVSMVGGLGATNRFIDKLDNAAFMLEGVKLAAPKGSTLVFCEAAFGGGVEAGLLASMGLWAVGAWWQIGLLCLVVVYSLSKPFGLPLPVKRKQAGGRDFVDGVSNLFRRAGAGAPALAAMLREANSEIYRKLKLPRDAGPGERDRVIPEKLSLLLRKVEAASLHRLSTVDAVQLARELDASMREFRDPS